MSIIREIELLTVVWNFHVTLPFVTVPGAVGHAGCDAPLVPAVCTM